VDKPAIRHASVGLCETYPNGGRVRGDITLVPGTETAIGLDTSGLHVTLSPAPDDGWVRRNVTVEGAVAARVVNYYSELGRVYIPFEQGGLGDVIKVMFDSITTSSPAETSAVYTFRRLEEPRATLSAWINDQWRDVNPLEVVGARPLRLRLAFTKAMDRDAVLAAVDSGSPGLTAVQWQSDRVLEFEVQSPPPAIKINLDEARDCDGLWVLGGLPALFTGTPPRLMAFKPGSAATSPLGALVPNVVTAVTSPDGAHLLVTCTAETTGWHPSYGGVKLVIDASTGAAREVDLPGTPVGWASEGSFVLVSGENWLIVDAQGRLVRQGDVPLGYNVASSSPDGTRLVSIRIKYDEWEEGIAYSADLAITDLANNRTTYFEDFTWVHSATDCYHYVAPVWSPDGARIAGVSDQAPHRGIRIADLSTGQVSTAVPMSGDGCLSSRQLSWSPDGKWWLLGDEIIASAGGSGTSRRLRGGPHGDLWGRHCWSPDSKYVAYGGGWGYVVVVSVSDSKAMHIQEGHFVCGWTKTGELRFITWPDYPYQYSPDW
jgi:hypothetical protein